MPPSPRALSLPILCLALIPWPKSRLSKYDSGTVYARQADSLKLAQSSIALWFAAQVRGPTRKMPAGRVLSQG